LNLTTFLTVSIPVILAFMAYFNSLRLERRKNRLERINRQLDEFYGPMLAIVQSNQQAWENFIAKYQNNPNFYKKGHHPTEEQVAEFHDWMSTIFMPNNDQLHDIIINNTSLLVEDEMPKVLLDLFAHIMEFRINFSERKDRHAEVAESRSKYPGRTLLAYCEERFKELKAEQIDIIKKGK
jgi:hypothetical protein